jgi:hypothetical protein
MVDQGIARTVTAALAALAASAAGTAAQDSCADRRGTARSITAAAGGAGAQADLGLTARLNRSSGVYAVDDALALEIATRAPASIEVWNIDASGQAARLAPLDPARPLLVGPGQALRLPQALGARYTVAPPAGRNEILVIARAAETRSADFDPDLVGRARHQDVILCYSIVQ